MRSFEGKLTQISNKVARSSFFLHKLGKKIGLRVMCMVLCGPPPLLYNSALDFKDVGTTSSELIMTSCRQSEFQSIQKSDH